MKRFVAKRRPMNMDQLVAAIEAYFDDLRRNLEKLKKAIEGMIPRLKAVIQLNGENGRYL